jgi:predicted histidine transporter YuiF (NhaC family)
VKQQEDMTWIQTILTLLGVAASLGITMMVLDYLPIQGLLGLLVLMFIVGFAIQQKKCEKCDMTPLNHQERVEAGIDGLE